jgi:hypothetical protein
MISRIKTIICVILLINFSSFGQNLEITHQGNGTTLSIPIESIDSVKFQLIPQPTQKKIYQNNGNILSLSVNDIDSITYLLPNSSDLPVLSTNTASVLSSNSAFCGGNVTSEGTSSVLQRGVCWSISPNPTLANNYTTDGIGLGTFSSSIYPLSPSTTYYLRAYATNSSGTAYGNSETITTSSAVISGSIPSVLTQTPSTYPSWTFYEGLTANCGGDVTADGGLAVIAKGVCYAIGTTPTINNSLTIDGSGAGAYSSLLTQLLPNTTYFVRAYATNDAGTGYGLIYSFTTFNVPTYPQNYVFCSGIPTSIVEITSPTTGRIWMDRNLDATQIAANLNDNQAFGGYFQWGRMADGHQCLNSPVINTLSPSDQPGNSSFINELSTQDWRTTPNDNLWQGVSGINNPCPSGYRIPTLAEFNAEASAWGSPAPAGAFNSFKFTLAGNRRNNGSTYNYVGSFGLYWTATLGSFTSYSTLFDISGGGIASENEERDTGASVRCIKN